MPKFWKVSLENTTTSKIKSSTSSLDLCAPTKLAQISAGSEQDEAEIQYDRWNMPEFKARLSWITGVLKIFAVEFNCVGNHFLEEFFSEIS